MRSVQEAKFNRASTQESLKRITDAAKAGRFDDIIHEMQLLYPQFLNPKFLTESDPFLLTDIYKSLQPMYEAYMRYHETKDPEAKRKFLQSLLTFNEQLEIYQTNRIGSLIPLSINFQIMSATDQARLILNAVREHTQNSDRKVGITYSANYKEQSVPLHEYFQQGERYKYVHGGGQAEVVMAIEALLKTDEFRDLDQRFFILPITTCEMSGGRGRVNNDWLKEDFGLIHSFMANGNIVLGWQNQLTEKTAAPFAIGGDRSKQLTTEQNSFIQTSLMRLEKNKMASIMPPEQIPVAASEKKRFSFFRKKQETQNEMQMTIPADFSNEIGNLMAELESSLRTINKQNPLDIGDGYYIYSLLNKIVHHPSTNSNTLNDDIQSAYIHAKLLYDPNKILDNRIAEKYRTELLNLESRVFSSESSAESVSLGEDPNPTPSNKK